MDCSTAAINQELKGKAKPGDAKFTYSACMYGTHVSSTDKNGRIRYREMKREEIAERNKELKGTKCHCEFCDNRVDETNKRRERAKRIWKEDFGRVLGAERYERKFGKAHVLDESADAPGNMAVAGPDE